MNGKQDVSVIGLGSMGAALAGALVAAGHRTTVWNRTAEKAEPLVGQGAVLAGSLAEAITASRLVVVCLLDDRSVRDVLEPVAGALAGRALVNLTNGTPAQALEMAAWAARHGADFLDGGIMAIPPMIGTPGSFVFYSGSREAFEAGRSALDCFGESRYLGAEPGMAALHDIALLSGMYGMFAGVLQAFALIRSEGVAATAFAPTLASWLEAMSGFVPGAAAQIDSGDYTIGVTSNLAMQTAAFPNLFETAKGQGVGFELLAPLHELMERRLAAGHGAEDIAGVIEEMKQ